MSHESNHNVLCGIIKANKMPCPIQPPMGPMGMNGSICSRMPPWVPSGSVAMQFPNVQFLRSEFATLFFRRTEVVQHHLRSNKTNGSNGKALQIWKAHKTPPKKKPSNICANVRARRLAEQLRKLLSLQSLANWEVFIEVHDIGDSSKSSESYNS